MNRISYENDDDKGCSGALGADSKAVRSRKLRSMPRVGKGSKTRADGSKTGKLGEGGVPTGDAGASLACSAQAKRDGAAPEGAMGGGTDVQNDAVGSLSVRVRDLQPQTDGKASSEAELRRLARRVGAYALRGVWDSYSTLQGLRVCGHAMTASAVDLRSKDGKTAYFSGVLRCASPWACPVCVMTIRAYRQQEVSEAGRVAVGQKGLYPVMVTRTQVHYKGQGLKKLMLSMSQAKRGADNAGNVKRLYESLGRVGGIMAKEVTVGEENGYHVHTHELMFFSEPFDLDKEQLLEETLFRAMNNQFQRLGMPKIKAGVGLKVQAVNKGVDAVGAYLAKLDSGFSPAMEMTRFDLKSGRRGSRSPFQVLADFVAYGDSADRDLYREYEQATKGHHVLHWTKGLRKLLLGDKPEPTDEELIAKEVEGLAYLRFENCYFREIKRKNLEPDIVKAFWHGGVDAVIQILIAYDTYDSDGLYVYDLESQEVKTAFDVKCDRELRVYGEALIQVKDRKDASDAMYLNFIHHGHWRYALDESPFG